MIITGFRCICDNRNSIVARMMIDGYPEDRFVGRVVELLHGTGANQIARDQRCLSCCHLHCRLVCVYVCVFRVYGFGLRASDFLHAHAHTRTRARASRHTHTHTNT